MRMEGEAEALQIVVLREEFAGQPQSINLKL